MIPLPSRVAALGARTGEVGGPSSDCSRSWSSEYRAPGPYDTSAGVPPVCLRSRATLRKKGASTVRTVNPYRDASTRKWQISSFSAAVDASMPVPRPVVIRKNTCLLYTSDAADEEDSVDL